MLNEILITEHPNSYRVTFPYKHQIGWPGFKQAGMWFKKPDNVGGIEGQVYWCIPKAKLQAALDVIQYWYTEHPLIGQSAYGVRVVEAATDTNVEATPRTPVKPYPNGALISPSLTMVAQRWAGSAIEY